MSSNLLLLAANIRRSTLSYIRTAYETNNTRFNVLRDGFIGADGRPNRIFGDELFELIPRYETGNKLLEDVLLEVFDRLESAKSNRRRVFSKAIKMLTDEVSYPPYIHQVEAITETIAAGKSIVVTTGTGSGKTLCFLVPVISNLLLESVGAGNRQPWSSTAASKHWWRESPNRYTYERGSRRTAAVRCLIIYPLNALVRDQIEVLRSILDSGAAEAFYNEELSGDRIYFGQYVGATRGRGSPKNQRERNKVSEYLRSAHADSLRAHQLRESGEDTELWRYVESPAGSQMLLRWDMQISWPDILITNFTMLSIMMVRDTERSLFESTREWLAESDENVFYLVLDELHSYRGTPGTEISHTIKLVLDRLGLFAGHPQLRIIATSASLEDQEAGDSDPQFLRDFFGVSDAEKQFTVIKGQTCISDGQSLPVELQNKLGVAFAAYGRGQLRIEQIDESLERICGQISAQEKGSFIENLIWGLQQSLRSRYSRVALLGPVPVCYEDLDKHLLGEVEGAGKGLITYIVKQDSNRFVDREAKLRLHLLVKTLSGLRRAMIADGGRLAEDAILYDQDTKFCPRTGRIALDALYCQVCGELYYRAYRQAFEDECPSSGTIRISNELDRPQSRATQIYLHEADPGQETPESWNRGHLRMDKLQLVPGLSGTQDSNSISVDWIECRTDAPPTTCVTCQTSWKSRGDNVTSPIRTMGTGYYKFSQLLIEQLFAALTEEDSSRAPASCISFSDSRRDAARFAAEVELNHYRDTLRAVAEKVISEFNGRLINRREFIEALSRRNQQKIDQLRQLLGNDAERIFLDFNFNKLSKDVLLARYLQPAISFRELFRESERHLIQKNFLINGFGVERQRAVLPLWVALHKDPGYRSEVDQDLVNEAQRRLQHNLGMVITDSLGRDFESLGLGWLTVDRSRPMPSGVDPSVRKDFYITIDTVLRFLSFYYKTRHIYETGLEDFRFPKYFYDAIVDSTPLKKVLRPEEFASNPELFTRLRELLQHYEVVDDRLRIRRENLFVHLPVQTFWSCGTCRGTHMFIGDGQCRTIKYRQRCVGQLEEHPLSDLLTKPNYYRDFLSERRHLYPIRTAEIIGHTPQLEQRDRQLAFQGKFLRRDIDRFAAEALKLDLLSVTTTMEAGVDIGGLKAVFLANMPPRRFNYQQRVGRAGRRKDRISVALTFCKGQKHDEYYFARPELMLAEQTASPKLDVANIDILARVILKWFMNRTVKEVYGPENFGWAGGGINSGRLGNLDTFQGKSDVWLLKMSDMAVVLERQAHRLSNQVQPAIARIVFEKCKENLLSAISNLDKWKRKYTGSFSLSEVLVKEGYFPLYGMPEREVRLLTKDPNSDPNNGEWPISEGFISRSEDIAIAEFAPQQEYLQDKLRYKSTAVTWLERSGGRIRTIDAPPHLVRSLYICSSCSRVTGELVQSCTACGGDAIQQFNGKRAEYYCSDRPQGYSGYIDSNPQSIIIAPAPEALGSSAKSYRTGAARVCSSFGTILRINCNEGRGFEVSQPSRRSATSSLGGVLAIQPSNQPPQRNVVREALYSEQFTSLLKVQLEKPPRYIAGADRAVRTLGIVNAAHRSLAELLKIGITLLEDIEPSELSASVQREGVWGIYLADTLDNGSGYAIKYAGPEEFDRLVNYVRSVFYEEYLAQPDHSVPCISSCYKCLRNYENRLVHPNLDWRLGIDLLDIYLGEHAFHMSMGGHWQSVIDRSKQLVENMMRTEVGKTQTAHGVVYQFRVGERGIGLLMRHPLLPAGEEQINALQEVKRSLQLDDVRPINPYWLLRDPIGELSRAHR